MPCRNVEEMAHTHREREREREEEREQCVRVWSDCPVILWRWLSLRNDINSYHKRISAHSVRFICSSRSLGDHIVFCISFPSRGHLLFRPVNTININMILGMRCTRVFWEYVLSDTVGEHRLIKVTKEYTRGQNTEGERERKNIGLKYQATKFRAKTWNM